MPGKQKRKRGSPAIYELAVALERHLRRIAADPALNRFPGGSNGRRHPRPFINPTCIYPNTGRYMHVRYIEGDAATAHHLDRKPAEDYLRWLNAGNVGTYWTYRHETHGMPDVVEP